MPTFPIFIPTNVVAELTAAAQELLDARKIDRTSMTATQVGQRYIAEILKDVVISRRTNSAKVTVQNTIDTATQNAKNDAELIV